MSASKPARVDRTTVIEDPIQRAVARRVGEVLDIFSDKFAAISPPERRLTSVPGTADAPGRVRNLTRPLAIGMIARLLLDLGAPRSRIHGWEALCGCTEIVELSGLHPHSVMQCRDTFAALCEDRSEFGRYAAQRYDALLESCRRDAEAFGAVLPEAAAVAASAPLKSADEQVRVKRARARHGVKVLAHSKRKKAKSRKRPTSSKRS